MSSFAFSDADGARHEVIVRQTPIGDWQVLDTSPAATTVVEMLDGRVDGRPQAEALARDYAANPGRWLPTAGRETAEAIPEQGGADADSDRRPRSTPPPTGARGGAPPHPAG